MIGRRRSAGRRPRALISVALALVLGGPVAVAGAAPTITIFSNGIFPTASPSVATLGPDGDVWFAQVSPATPLARIAPDGAVTDVSFAGIAPLPFAAWPTAIATDADGDVWFVAGTIYRITPAGTVTSLASSLPVGALPIGIAAGPGGTMWFTDIAGGGAIGRIAPDGTVTEFRAGLQPGAEPGAITAGPDGDMWFTDAGPTPGIASITPAGAITELGGLHGQPLQIAAGPDGNLWFTEAGPFNGVGRMSPAGALTEFPTGVPVHGIVAAEDGRLYFTEPLAGTIGAITPAGGMTMYSTGAIFPFFEPWDLALGADGNVWFTDPTVPAAVGRLTVAPIVTAGSVAVTSDTATVTGEVQGNGQPTTYWFQYGTTTAYGEQTTPVSAPVADGPQPVSGTLDGLSPGTTYHYRLVASNGTGTTAGGDQTLTTSAAPVDGNGTTTTTTSASGTPPAPPADSAVTSSLSSGTATTTLLSLSATKTSTTSTAASHDAGGSSSADAPDGGLLDVSLAPLSATGVRAGHSVAIGTVAGVVYFRVPGSDHRVRLGSHSVIPVGAIIDARAGIVKLTAAHTPLAHGARATTAAARLQTGAFSGGMFVVRQNGTAAHAPVAIVLEGGAAAACTATAHGLLLRAAAKRPKRPAPRKVSKASKPHAVVRMLWSKDSGGDFSTHGRDSVGTVQGTLWLTQDRCDGTLTRVVRGKVLVRALFIHRSVLVTAGHAYLAPARG